MTVIALGLVAIWPLLRRPLLACTDDAGLHLLRLTELNHLLRSGLVYSRWAPDMALGYGFPFFNFYAPLAYYIAAAVSGLGAGLNLGLRLTFALGILGSGLAAYRLARDHFSRPAALVAATAVMYAPYHGYDVYFRGNLAEALAWPFLVLSLWAMGRLAQRGGGRWLPVAALAAAAVLLTHNVFALVFLPLLGLYGVSEAWFAGAVGSRWRRVGSVAAAMVLALGLSTFFWVPALWEQRYVHIDRLLVPPDFVYWNNFLGWPELLAAPRAIVPDLLNPSPARALGLVPALLALPALGGLWRWRDGRRRQVAFFGAAALVYTFLTTAASAPVWEAAALLEFVQFPWRLLGPAAIALAMVLAAAIDFAASVPGRRQGKAQSLLAGAAIVVLVLAALFWFDPRYCGGLQNPQIGDLAEYELATGTIGTTAKGEYLPRTVEVYPPAEVPAPARFAAMTLPAGVEILETKDSPPQTSAVVEVAEPVQLTANLFAYPGWRASVDGEPVAITPEAAYGRVTLPLPAGRHEVVLRFGETPLRLAADLVSGAALLLVAILLVHARRQGAAEQRPAGRRQQIGFLLLGIGLFGLVAVLPRLQSPLARDGLRDGVLRDVQEARDVRYHGGMRLLGFRSSTLEPVPAGDAVRYDLFWTVIEDPKSNYQSTLQLAGLDGQLWSRKDTERPRDFRAARATATWQPGQFAGDSHLLAALPGTPPGIYEVQLLLFDRESLQPASVVGSANLAVGLGQMELGRPRRPATVAELQPQYVVERSWSPLRLLGYNLDRNEAAPGEPFLLTLFWQAEAAPAEDFTVELSLLSAQDEVVFARQLPPVRADFPTSAWEWGDVWRGQHLLRLPPDMESGTYRWQLALCHGDSCRPAGEPLELGILDVNAPERRYDLPEMALPLGEPVGEVATLLGANVTPEQLVAGGWLEVTLIWRPEAETRTSYRVFVHLLGPDGAVASQSDGEPAGWRRPTTGWLPGEIVADGHQLPLPAELGAGTYRLVAGLYEPQSGARLHLPGGEDAVTIRLFAVGEP